MHSPFYMYYNDFISRYKYTGIRVPFGFLPRGGLWESDSLCNILSYTYYNAVIKPAQRHTPGTSAPCAASAVSQYIAHTHSHMYRCPFTLSSG
jgi:hypothetical protein